MYIPSVKTVIYVPSTTIFQNKIFLFYKSKSIGQSPISTCFYQVPCVFVGSEFSGSNFYRGIHMSNQEYRVFHPRWYLSLLTQHTYFSFPFFYAVRIILDVVPFYRAHHRTLNTVSIYQPCTHTHLMRCPRAYAMQDAISCYIMSHA